MEENPCVITVNNNLEFEMTQCKVIHISTYKPSTNKPTITIDKDRPARYKERGTHNERTARLAKHIKPPDKISPRHNAPNFNCDAAIMFTGSFTQTVHPVVHPRAYYYMEVLPPILGFDWMREENAT